MKEEKQYDEFGLVIRPNRSQLKREREPIKQFAQELLKLPNRQYPLLPINETLQSALIEGKRLTGNALARHLSYLTRLIDEQGFETIQKAHEHINHPFINNQAKTKKVQQEMKRLIQQDEKIIGDLMEKYLDFDVQYVRQLVRETIKEQKANPDNQKMGKHQRQLQQYLSGLALNQNDDE